MVTNQNLGTLVPGSKLAEELLGKRSLLQQEITKLENEELLSVRKKPSESEDDQKNVKKVEDGEGRVRIWSSS